jgi:hypothetical protein
MGDASVKLTGEVLELPRVPYGFVPQMNNIPSDLIAEV